ncbi:MAG TPA: hypothetical protein VHF69_12550 [Candidatus Synoicihabitans sp.]|nr:hypothetical protein [Candidatus Synoicihabitans sp.]
MAWLGLVLSIIPALLVFRGTITWNTYQTLMVVGMLLWFVGAVIWIKPERADK